MADGCVVKHKIECVGNADGTFHFEAGAPVRQVADHTIDHRLVTFEDDLRSLENAVARFIFAPLRWLLFHCSSSLGPDRGSDSANARSGNHGSCVLLLRNARVLRCWPGEPPTGTIAER
jgi:hypothetical protein